MSEFKSPPYSVICALAGPQGGFAKRRQLLDLGVSPRTIDLWLSDGRLTHVWHGVYAVGPMPTDPVARAFGATLAAGEDSAIAGFSAGAFYGVLRHWPETFELISPRQRRVQGLTVHRASTLAGRDVWRFGGLRVTSPARTALDLAPHLSHERLLTVVDQLRLRPRDKLTISALEDVIARNPRHPGVPALTRVLVTAGRRPRRSKLERVGWPAFAAAWNLPPYEQNVMVGGHEVDVLVDGLVAVEIDTVETHLLKFESDRLRDAEILARTGIPVIRITATQMKQEAERVAGNILATVARRRRETGRAAQ